MCWSLYQLSSREGGVTPWTRRLQHRNTNDHLHTSLACFWTVERKLEYLERKHTETGRTCLKGGATAKEVKLFAKILGRRLGQLMIHQVHYDQTGFMKSSHASDMSSGAFYMSSRVVPASGAQYVSMISVLYSNPIARVLIGGTYLDNLFIYSCTRQGALFSPLFAILL